MNSLGYIVNDLQVIINQVALSGTIGNMTVTGATFDAQGPTVLYGIMEVNRTFTSELRGISSYEAAALSITFKYQLLQSLTISVNFARITNISPGYAATTTLVSFVTSVSANVSDAVLTNFNTSVAATPMFLQGSLSPEFPLCTAKMDVVFVLDGSGSVGYDNFQRMKSFVKRVAGSFAIRPSATQISLFQYSSFVMQEFALDTYGSIGEINQAVDAVMYQGGGTATGLALYEMRQYGFSFGNGGRPGTRRVAILLTDGMSSDSVDKHAMAAWQAGISLYVVGIGSNVDMDELLAIGGTPDNVFGLSNFGQLQDLSNRLPNRLCELGRSTNLILSLDVTSVPCSSILRQQFACLQTALNQAGLSYQNGILSVAPINLVRPLEYSYLFRLVFSQYARAGITSTVNPSTTQLGNLTVASVNVRDDDSLPLFVMVEVNYTYIPGMDQPNSAVFAYWTNVFETKLTGLENVTGILSVIPTAFRPGNTATSTIADVTLVVSQTARSFVQTALVAGFRSGDIDGHPVIDGTVSTTVPLCPAKMEVVFVLDGSGSVGYDNFQRMKSFVKRVAGSFAIRPSATQISLFQYSSFVMQEFALDTYGSIGEINQAIDVVMYQGGGTATGLALYEMRQYGFSFGNGGRPGTRRVAILLTDGMSSDSVDKHAMAAWQAGISLYVVGIGSNVDMNELLAIGGTPDNIFGLSNFGQLQDLSNRLPNRLCELGRSMSLIVSLDVASMPCSPILRQQFICLQTALNQAGLSYENGILSVAPINLVRPLEYSYIFRLVFSQYARAGITSTVNPATTQLGNLTVASVNVRDDDSLPLFVMVEVNYTYIPGMDQPNSAVFTYWTNVFETKLTGLENVTGILSVIPTAFRPGNTATSTIADVTLVVSQTASMFVQTALVAGFRSGDIDGHPVIGGTVSTTECALKIVKLL
ncbi:matrilin-4-like [Branchiostoma lanceolatum]|uniref:matrilin-4-like n=1 Tax=Branchiostoma lanceolatum TaxID=7740 RepID=UPI00345724C0